MGPFFCCVGCRRNAGGKRVPDYSSRVGWPFRIGPSRKMHPGMSAQTGTHFPDRPSSGSCVPDSGSRVGCRFRLRSLAEAVSRNRASEWDVLSRQELKWKLRPGFKPRNGTCFPDGLQAETVSQNRHGFKWKTRLRIPRRRFWRLWWARGHRLHTRRRRGGDPHGGTWGVVVLRGVGLPLPKIHLVNQMLADRIKLTAAQVVKSWAAPLLGQEVNALMAATCYASNAA